MTLNAARDLQAQDGARERQDRGVRRACADFGGEADEPEPDDPAERLWAAVRTLPDKQREAVLLVYGEGLEPRRGGRCDGMRGSDRLLAHP